MVVRRSEYSHFFVNKWFRPIHSLFTCRFGATSLGDSDPKKEIGC